MNLDHLTNIRQGDHLTLFPFIIIVEGLACIIRQAKKLRVVEEGTRIRREQIEGTGIRREKILLMHQTILL